MLALLSMANGAFLQMEGTDSEFRARIAAEDTRQRENFLGKRSLDPGTNPCPKSHRIRAAESGIRVNWRAGHASETAKNPV